MLTYILLVDIVSEGEHIPRDVLQALGFECLDGWWRKTARIRIDTAVQAAMRQGEHRLLAVRILAIGAREARPGIEPLIKALTLLATCRDRRVAKAARSGLSKWREHPEIFVCLTQGKEHRKVLRSLNLRAAKVALKMDRITLRERWADLISS